MKLGKRQWPLWLWVIHGVILVNFLIQMGYAAAMVFLVVAPETAGPLWEAAHTFPFEKMVTRRLYAMEFWIATVGFSLYIAVTEMLPRLLRPEGTGESK